MENQSAKPKPDRTQPIFIVGTERSGSNLLRLVLNSHSGIVIPHPPHIIRYFAPFEQHYLGLDREIGMPTLVGDILDLIDTHIHPWNIRLDKDRIIRLADPRDLFGVFYAIYDQVLEKSGKRRWGCKSTFMIDHVERVIAHYPQAKFLWLVRDPRDVAASSGDSVFNPYHPYFCARLWREQQQKGQSLSAKLLAGQILLVRYEDLITEPERSIRKICSFIDEEFEPEMLAFHRCEEARSGSRLSRSWRNTAKPILRTNTGQYRNKLTRRDIELVERTVGLLMTDLGYRSSLAENLAGQPPVPSSWSILLYRIIDWRMALVMEGRSLVYDKNHWLRWKRAMFLMKIKWSRWLPVRKGKSEGDLKR